MLGAYIDYNKTSSQSAWLKKDLQKVNRDVTPWLVAAWHSPWYNSYSSHYQEFECMRQEMEELLYHSGVDCILESCEWSFLGSSHSFLNLVLSSFIIIAWYQLTSL